MTSNSIRKMMGARSIAIVGASERNPWSTTIFEGLRTTGFPGPVFPLNANRDEVWGAKCYRAFADLPETPDHAAIFLHAEAAIEQVRYAAEAGVGSATLIAAGFGEADDEEGKARREALRATFEGRDFRLCGPNCMGFVAPRERILTFPHPRLAREIIPGNLGFVSQSGGNLQFFLLSGAERGLGISYAVASGNELDLDLADYLNFMIEDKATAAVCLFIEGVRRPAEFLRACKRAYARRKPIVVLKTGRTQEAAEAARSHTGAVAGDDRVFDAVCDRYRLIRVDSLDEMLEVALCVAHGRLPRGERTFFVTLSGGMKELILDEAARRDVSMASIAPATGSEIAPRLLEDTAIENPLDLGAAGFRDEGNFAEICRSIAADRGVDLLAVHGLLPRVKNEPPVQDPKTFRQLVERADVPVVGMSRIGHSVNDRGRRFREAAGMPFLQGIPGAMSAVKALASYSAEREIPDTLQGRGEPFGPPPSQDELRELLVDHGVPLPPGGIATAADEAAEIADRLGYPVAVKLVSSKILHKTEAGGIVLNLQSDDEVRAAVSSISKRAAAGAGADAVDGFLIQRMVKGLEMMIGIREDPQFGPFALIGFGGVLVEVLDDVALCLLPLSEACVREMLCSLKGAKLLDGYRGTAPRDADALVRTALALERAFLTCRNAVRDLEANPVIVGEAGEGVWAVDVRIT